MVTVTKDQQIFIDQVNIPLDRVEGTLREAFTRRTSKEAYLRADKDVPYGEVVKAMAEIKGAGIERLGMVTEPAQRK